MHKSTTRPTPERPVIVIGAGPAGLTAAHELERRGTPVVVCEHSDQMGGLARTVQYKGFRFDIGGHRFFTKSATVNALWRSVLGADFLMRKRQSRIYYAGRFFDYPLKPLNALFGLGVGASLRVVGSYLWARLRPIRPEVTFADWVTNRFGRHLYKTFFETYTAKVWGIPPHLIGAQWAAQRIKGLSLRSALKHMLSNPRRRAGQSTARTLIDEFHYPRLGPGMMWERLAAQIEAAGVAIRTSTSVVALHHNGGRVEAVEIDTAGRRDVLPAGHVISTMAIRDLIGALRPLPPPDVTAAAGSLKYRDFLTVALILDVADVFPDNWIYVHDSAVKVGRIQNFKNWSPDMVPDASRTCLGLEYFCAEGDGLWSMTDADLVALATRELAAIGLASPAQVVDGTVVRVRKAYPVYDNGYMEALNVVRTYVDGFTNLQLVGRNGMHKYNNQDHSMLAAMLAVRNLDGERHDLWALNSDDDYHEGTSGDAAATDLGADGRRIASTQPRVPRPLSVRRDEP